MEAVVQGELSVIAARVGVTSIHGDGPHPLYRTGTCE